MDELHPLVEQLLIQERLRMRSARHKEELPSFNKGVFVLVTRQHFDEDEKQCLLWRGPLRITQCLNYFVFKVEDLRNGGLQDVHGTQLKDYSDNSLDAKAI